MRAAQTVYLTMERKPVAEGDKAAQFLLIRAGQEISQAELDKYPGAIELVGGTKAAVKGIETREPVIENRDPKKKTK